MPSFERGTSLARIQQAGVLRIGVVTDAPGFSSLNLNTGRYEGLDISVARRLGQAIFGGSMFDVHRNIEFVALPLGGRISAIVEEQVDMVVSVLSVTDERRKLIDFTTPYYGAVLTGFARRDGWVEDVRDLSKASVALIDSTVEAALVRQRDLASKIVETERNEQTFEAVRDGRADVGIIATALLEGFMPADDPELRRLPWVLDNYSFAVGVRKGDEVLKSFLDVQVEDLVQRGFVALADVCRKKNR